MDGFRDPANWSYQVGYTASPDVPIPYITICNRNLISPAKSQHLTPTLCEGICDWRLRNCARYHQAVLSREKYGNLDAYVRGSSFESLDAFEADCPGCISPDLRWALDSVDTAMQVPPSLP